MPKKPNYAKFFSVYLAQDISDDYKGEAVLDCPFHECPNPTNHFYANCETGQWSCKRCEEQGNARSLITKIHAQYQSTTDSKKLSLLGKLRKLDPHILDSAGFAYDHDNDRWLVPYYTYDPELGDFTLFLNNLGYFYPSSTNPKSQFVIHKAPTLPLYLYNPGLHTYPCPTSHARICEGEWDTLAYYEMFQDSDDLILGKPGSGFPIAFMNTLAECTDISLLLDNDQSGRKQVAATIDSIHRSKIKKNIFILDWPLVPNQEKDLRDYKIKYPDSFCEDIHRGIIPYETMTDSSSDPESPTTELTAGYVRDCTIFDIVPSFQEYIDKTQTLLYINDETKLAMAAVFAITTSIDVPGEPLWGFVRGPASCLAHDTEVKISRAGKTFTCTIEHLHKMFHGGIAGGKRWSKEILSMIQRRESNGSIRLVPIVDVIDSGKKECFRVITETGHNVSASKDHKFLTQDGWKRLSELVIHKDSVFINAGKTGTESQKPRGRQQYVYGLTFHPLAKQPAQGSGSKSRGKNRVLKHRLVYEAYMNDLPYEEYITILRLYENASSTLKFLQPEDIIRHKDENHSNNNLDNLELVDRVVHGQIHGEANHNNVAEKTQLSKIVAIVPVGEQHTYDITVNDDPHNFLANGIVVHNSGKTTFIESFGGSNQWFDNLSKLTAEALVSGWKDDSGEDCSYLPSLTHPSPKTLFIKDFTTVLTSTTEVQQKMFGLLTDIYDGHVKIPYGNNQIREYHNTYFNMIAGVTDILDAYSSASIGERFLRIDWLGDNYDSREYGRRALDNFGNTSSNKMDLTANTLGFCRYLRDQPLDLTIPEEFKDPILDLAEFIAILRTKVESDRFEGIKYRPRPELIPRLSKQLAKLYVGGRIVTNSNEQAFAIVRKVALDTCYGFPLDIVKFILNNPQSSREDVSEGAEIHSQRAYRVLRNLETTGVIKECQSPSNRRNGRPRKYFELNPKLLPALLPSKYINEPEKTNKNRSAIQRSGRTDNGSNLRSRRKPPTPRSR